MASSPPSPGPQSSEFRIPRLPTGLHTPSPGGHTTPVAHKTLATPPSSPGRVAVATDAQSVGGAVPFVPAPVPWAAVAAPPPGPDGPFMPQARPAASFEAASRPLSLLLPPRPGRLTAGLLNSVWAGGRATQGGGGPAVALVEETSHPFCSSQRGGVCCEWRRGRRPRAPTGGRHSSSHGPGGQGPGYARRKHGEATQATSMTL